MTDKVHISPWQNSREAFEAYYEGWNQKKHKGYDEPRPSSALPPQLKDMVLLGFEEADKSVQ